MIAFPRRAARVLALNLLVSVLCPASAMAQQEEASARFSVQGSLLSSGTLWLDEPGFTFSLLGVEVGAIFSNQVVVEAAGQLYFGFDAPGYGASARLGYAFRQTSARFGFEDYWIPFVGYAYNVHALDGDLGARFNHTQNIQLGVARDHLLGGQTEFVLRFLGALEYAVSSTRRDGPWVNAARVHDSEGLFRFGLHLGVSVGLSWD